MIFLSTPLHTHISDNFYWILSDESKQRVCCPLQEEGFTGYPIHMEHPVLQDPQIRINTVSQFQGVLSSSLGPNNNENNICYVSVWIFF